MKLKRLGRPNRSGRPINFRACYPAGTSSTYAKSDWKAQGMQNLEQEIEQLLISYVRDFSKLDLQGIVSPFHFPSTFIVS